MGNKSSRPTGRRGELSWSSVRVFLSLDFLCWITASGFPVKASIADSMEPMINTLIQHDNTQSLGVIKHHYLYLEAYFRQQVVDEHIFGSPRLGL